ncbi:hypothetical protein HanPSC8_Chr12g0523211 [Helianthus annuus]|nr:hypothetical protein HanPSC8_Chr12g0523211 [Helianthus annuus]
METFWHVSHTSAQKLVADCFDSEESRELRESQRTGTERICDSTLNRLSEN